MAEQKIQKTLDIRVNYSEALDGVAKYRMELDRAKAEAKLMTEALKNHAKQLNEGKITEEQYAKAVMETQKQLAANKQEQSQLSDAIRTSEKVIKNQITQQNLADDSIKALRAQLSNLTKEYDELSAAERNNAEVGGKLLASINDVTDQIKDAEEATQRYYRNVGNYTNSITEAMEQMGLSSQTNITQIVSSGNNVVDSFLNMATSAGGLKQAFVTAGTAAVGLAKQLLALAMNPVGAVILAIAAALIAMKKGLESSEERMNRFKVVTAPLKGILDGLSNALGKVCGWLLDIVEAATDTIMWLGKLAEKIPGLGKAMKEANDTAREYIDIERQRQAITQMERDEIVKSAEREREISELRAKFAEKDKYTNKERLAFLEQASAKEKEQAEANKKIAQEKFDLAKREAALTDNNKEANDALAQAEREVIQADTALSNKMRELNAQRVEAINGIKAEAEAEKKAAEERNNRTKQQLETEEQLWREYEDALLDLIKDGYEKQKQVVATQYQREIDDLQKRLKEEENLTKSAKDAIEKLIIAKRQEMNQQIAEIDKAATDEQIQKDAEMLQRKAEVERMSMENRLKAVQEGSLLFLELSRQQADKEHELRQQEIDQELLLEQNRIENLVATQEEKDALLLLAQKKYNEQTIANDQERAEAQKQIAKAEAQMKVDAFNSVKSGIDAMAQHSKAFAIMSKTIALAEIAINTGKAIAYGVTQAMQKGFPLALIDIAMTMGTVLSNMATAISTVKSAKFAKGGRVDTRQYASGGDVRGAGTGTSDSIHAMLSNGESVMTAAATSMYAPVLSAMNQSAGGNPITGGGSAQGEDMLARAVARGLMAMPNPVVSVEEINTTARRVQVLENLASIG